MLEASIEHFLILLFCPWSPRLLVLPLMMIRVLQTAFLCNVCSGYFKLIKHMSSAAVDTQIWELFCELRLYWAVRRNKWIKILILGPDFFFFPQVPFALTLIAMWSIKGFLMPLDTPFKHLSRCWHGDYGRYTFAWTEQNKWEKDRKNQMEMRNESGCWEGMLSDKRAVMGLVIAQKRLMLVHSTVLLRMRWRIKQAKKQHETFLASFKFSSITILWILEAQPTQKFL